MKITIYMKSGNKIVLRGIREYEIGNNGNEIQSMSITRSVWWPGCRILVKTVDLSQIEAVTRG